MRILITLLCGVAALCPLDARAGEAKLTIKAGIISYADWQRMSKDKAIIIVRPINKENAPTPPGAPVVAEFKEKTKLEKIRYLNARQRVSRFESSALSPQEKFMTMDVNNDNIVTRREYLISTGTPVTDSDFSEYDLNDDGFLSLFETNSRLYSKNYIASN